MEKLLFKIILLLGIIILPVSVLAEVDVQISIPLPPPIIFPAPPSVVVIPETYVYAVPDVQEEIFFYNGWWWRPWKGRWYRSRHYDRGWAHYHSAPAFYTRVPRGWRDDYREHRWRGQRWDHRPIPHQDVERNWQGWQKDKHWEKQNTWGVQGLERRPHGIQPVRQQHLESRPHDALPPQDIRKQNETRQPREGQPMREVRTPSEPRQRREVNTQVQPRQQHEVKTQGRFERDAAESRKMRPPSGEVKQGKKVKHQDGPERDAAEKHEKR